MINIGHDKIDITGKNELATYCPYVDVEDGTIENFLCDTYGSLKETSFEIVDPGDGSYGSEFTYYVYAELGGINIGYRGHIHIPKIDGFINTTKPAINYTDAYKWSPDFKATHDFGSNPEFYCLYGYQVYGGKVSGKVISHMRDSKFINAELFADVYWFVENENFAKHINDVDFFSGSSIPYFKNSNVNIREYYYFESGRVSTEIETLFNLSENTVFTNYICEIYGLSDEKITALTHYTSTGTNKLIILTSNSTYSNTGFLKIFMPVNTTSMPYKFDIFDCKHSTVELSYVNCRSIGQLIHAKGSTVRIISSNKFPIITPINYGHEYYDESYFNTAIAGTNVPYGSNIGVAIYNSRMNGSYSDMIRLETSDLFLGSTNDNNNSMYFHSAVNVTNNGSMYFIAASKNSKVFIGCPVIFSGKIFSVFDFDYSSLLSNKMILLQGIVATDKILNAIHSSFEVFEFIIDYSTFLTGFSIEDTSVLKIEVLYFISVTMTRFFNANDGSKIYLDQTSFSSVTVHQTSYPLISLQNKSSLSCSSSLSLSPTINVNGTFSSIFYIDNSLLECQSISFNPTIGATTHLITYCFYLLNGGVVDVGKVDLYINRCTTIIYMVSASKFISKGSYNSGVSTLTASFSIAISATDNCDLEFLGQLTITYRFVSSTNYTKLVAGLLIRFNSRMRVARTALTLVLPFYNPSTSDAIISVSGNSSLDAYAITITTSNATGNTTYNMSKIIYAIYNSVVNCYNNIVLTGPTSNRHTFTTGLFVANNSKVACNAFTCSNATTTTGVDCSEMSTVYLRGALSLYIATTIAIATLASKIIATTMSTPTTPTKTPRASTTPTFGTGGSFIISD